LFQFQWSPENVSLLLNHHFITLGVGVVDSLNDWQLISPVAAPGAAVHVSEEHENQIGEMERRCDRSRISELNSVSKKSFSTS